MNKFKVGDKVYSVSKGRCIYTLESNYPNRLYPLRISNVAAFTEEGRIVDHISYLPDLLPATPENYELLTKLFGDVWEQPEGYSLFSASGTTKRKVIQFHIESNQQLIILCDDGTFWRSGSLFYPSWKKLCDAPQD
ncbi:hypothetical protein CRG49_002105 [Neisseria sp. N95_16]|uniref:Uncharacterized protein n=1 Tax=Neisseria brasiliensis TaxID=2666100 RepID=A0A7X2KZS1_9NEIS|nr:MULTISPECIES: hypothetical protein [Neisseria]MRN38580.1 hypothetical protein [Neisseria brasiliensis]PJO10498.1 hypothetical protein CRG49_002105 [Neisseria sp. N95_16]